MYCWQSHQSMFPVPSTKTRVKPVFCLNWPFSEFTHLAQISTLNFCIIIYSFVCQFPLLLSKTFVRRCSYKLCKIHRKKVVLECLCSAQVFSCQFCKIDCYIITCAVYCSTTTFRLVAWSWYLKDVTRIFRLDLWNENKIEQNILTCYI